MSYEGKMLEQLAMPTRRQVEQALLQALLKHGGAIREFGSGQEIVDEIADAFELNEQQRSAFLETVYRKENRVKKSLLWHRLFFRAADSLAKENLVSRPTQTVQLTQRKEWLLTEKGFDEALTLSNIPITKKNSLPTKSYEVQKIVKKLNESPRPENYNPFDKERKVTKATREYVLRLRGFRQAVIEAYDCRCAVCRLKINSPDSLSWEVEAAHIVPHSSLGRDDIWNGIALCHLHHWAFDVGWFTLQDDYMIQSSPQIHSLPSDFGRLGDYEFFRALSNNSTRILLPSRSEIHPHHNAIRWHRQNVFHQ
jgi:predicted restriction endonuclease